MARANCVTITPRTPASEFIIRVNRLQISLMIRDPFVARCFRVVEDDDLAPAMVETDHPKLLDSGVAELIGATGRFGRML